MLNKIINIIKMIKITFSSNFAMKVANDYWQNTMITHSSMDEKEFDFYYKEIKKIVNPLKEDLILDYGGGNGEIAYRFLQDGYDIEHCDLSNKMVQNAKEKYGLKSCICENLKSNKYTKILCHNAFFYIHPNKIDTFLQNIYEKLDHNGIMYITDTPDFDKRKNLNMNKIYYILTQFFPVYQISLAGFFVKDKELRKKAKLVGFEVKKLDSWANYRSNWVLRKVIYD